MKPLDEFQLACYGQESERIKLIMNNHKINIFNNAQAIIALSMIRDIDIIKFITNLYKTNKKYKPIKINDNFFINQLCSRGKINTLKYVATLFLYDKKYKPINFIQQHYMEIAKRYYQYEIVNYLTNMGAYFPVLDIKLNVFI